jgi:hypothetical protein
MVLTQFMAITMSMAQLSFPTTLVLVPPGESITHTSITTFKTVFYHIFAIWVSVDFASSTVEEFAALIFLTV